MPSRMSGHLFMSSEELDRLQVLVRVSERRLTQREAALILGVTEQEGWWIVGFDVDEENGDPEGLYAVDPAGWVFDSGVWYPIVETSDEGVWYTGDDGYDYFMVHDLEYLLDVASEQVETA